MGRAPDNTWLALNSSAHVQAWPDASVKTPSQNASAAGSGPTQICPSRHAGGGYILYRYVALVPSFGCLACTASVAASFGGLACTASVDASFGCPVCTASVAASFGCLACTASVDASFGCP
eukprot:358804-Chlamydomonas_euryale.AAC.3